MADASLCQLASLLCFAWASLFETVNPLQIHKAAAHCKNVVLKRCAKAKATKIQILWGLGSQAPNLQSPRFGEAGKRQKALGRQKTEGDKEDEAHGHMWIYMPLPRAQAGLTHLLIQP